MADEASNRFRFVCVGWLSVAVGIADIIRLIPEVSRLEITGPIYVALVLQDVLLGTVAIVAGWALLKERGWARSVALLIWGALLSSSAWILWISVPLLRHGLDPGRAVDWVQRQTLIVLPRSIFYCLTVAAAPLAIHWLWTTPASIESGSRVRWRFLGIGLAGGAFSAAVLMSLHYL